MQKLLDACHLGKKIVETLPELPTGLRPKHVRVLEVIGRLNGEGMICRVSEVCQSLKITMPSVTRMIQEIERLGMINKCVDERDKRVSHLVLTDLGKECVEYYITNLQKNWGARLDQAGVSREDVYQMLDTMEKLWATMPKEGNINE